MLPKLKSLTLEVKRLFNPNYLFSPLFLKTVSIEQLESEVGPVIYQQSEVLNCPEFMEMNAPPNMRSIQSKEHVSPEATFRVIDNLVYVTDYLPKNMLLTENRKFIVESSSTMCNPGHFKWRNAYRPIAKSYSGLTMVYRGVSNNFYHTIIDNLPRLMALHHPEMKSLGGVKLLVTHKISNVEAELFRRVLPGNVDVEVVPSGKAFRLERCLFVTFATQQFSGYVPSGVLQWLRKYICPDRERVRNKLIYISRSSAPKRKLLNEDEIVNHIKKLGFQVYTLEDMDFMSQVELFYDAKCVVGMHGAGFTNIIFSKDVNVVEIFPYQYVKPSYYLMTKAVGGRYFPVTGNGEEINVNVSMSLDKIIPALNQAMNGL